MSYPDTTGPFQVMYQSDYDKYHAVAVAYTWEQVEEVIIDCITNHDYGLDYFFIRDLSDEKAEYGVSQEFTTPLRLAFHLLVGIPHD